VARNARPPLHGAVSIMLVVFWCTIGIYARHLTRCMLIHPNIRAGVQLVFKSIFRMNAAVLTTLFGVSLLVINNYSARIHLDMQQRENATSLEITLAREVMFASRVVFTLLALLWNLLVVFILLSTCRSHTLEIRRFVRYLEVDASAYDAYCNKLYLGTDPATQYNIFEGNVQKLTGD